MIPLMLSATAAQRFLDLGRARLEGDLLRTNRAVYLWDAEHEMYAREPDAALPPLPRRWWQRRLVLAAKGRPLEEAPLPQHQAGRPVVRALGGLLQLLGLALLVFAGAWWSIRYAGLPSSLAFACLTHQTDWCQGIGVWQQLAGQVPYMPQALWAGVSALVMGGALWGCGASHDAA